MEEVRQELTTVFPQWFISAAEHHEVSLGQVIRFSTSRWFFPDCNVVYTNNGERVYQVFLLVEIDSTVENLLAHPPGSFHYPGATLSYPAAWEELVSLTSSPGGLDEVITIFLATGLSDVPEDERHEREHEEAGMPTGWVTLDDAVTAVLAGQVHNGPLMIGVLALAERLRRETGR